MSIHQLRHKDTAPQGADVVESDAEYDVKRRANVGVDNAEFTYINVYLADRAYGGSEEGGWWYDYGIPVESRRVKLPSSGAVLKITTLEASSYDQSLDETPSTSTAIVSSMG